jgi:ribosomal-protein-alanine N-acetyltransferase
VNIRPAEPADRPALQALAAQSLPSWPADAFAPADARQTLVAELPPHGLVGFVVVQFAFDEAELQALAVAAGFRRQGLGAALTDAAVACARRRRARVMFLEVRAGNHAAQALYRRLGFETFGQRRRYYRDPEEDAVLMRATLNTPPPHG